MSRRPRAWLLGLLLAALGACGFQLRGSYQLPPTMTRTYVQGSEFSAVVVGLRRALRASGVTLAEGPDSADSILQVSAERTGRRVLSVASDGRISEYEVFYSLDFAVRPASESRPGHELAAQSLRLTREYLYDETGVLGKSEEEEILREEMQRDLVRLIMYRLEARGS